MKFFILTSFILGFLMLIFFANCNKNKLEKNQIDVRPKKFVYVAFELKNGSLSTLALQIFINTKEDFKNMQLIGVGWYEFSKVNNGHASFVFEDHGQTLKERNTIYSNNDICDIYKLINKGLASTAIHTPKDIVEMHPDEINNKESYLIGDIDFKSLVTKIKTANYYEANFIEPGFIAFEENKFKKIIFGKVENEVLFIRLLNEKNKLDFILIPNNEKTDSLFQKNKE